MKGVVLPGVVGEQDVVDVVVGLARQLELGESVVVVAVRAPHREFDGVLAVLLLELFSALLKRVSSAVKYPSPL